MQPIMQFVGNLGYVGVAISGGLLAIRGTIGVGEIQAFIQYVRNFTQPIQQIAQVANMLQSMAAASERVFEFLDEEEEELTVEHAVHLDHVDGYVDFSHVSFGYNPPDHYQGFFRSCNTWTENCKLLHQREQEKPQWSNCLCVSMM